MSGENSINTAVELYESGSYKEAFDVAAVLMDEEETKAEGTLLVAKAFLNMLLSPENEGQISTLLNTVSELCGYAKSIEEMKRFEREIFSAFHAWKARTLKNKLAELEQEATLKKYDSYIPLHMKYLMLDAKLQIVMRNCDFAKKYQQENNMSVGEYVAFMTDAADEAITDAEIGELEYEAARRIFNKAKQLFEQNSHGSAELLSNVVEKVIDKVELAQLMVSSSMKEDTEDTIKCERTKTIAEIRRFMLNAVAYPNGRAISVYSGSTRNEELQKLKENYEQIKKWEPGFLVPTLPSAQEVGYQPSASTTPSSSSGGCYVATAVYGSYDCPQVWTLRRFRDDMLAETWHGRLFIRTYYAVSPTLVKWFGETAWFKNLWKPQLDKMVKKLNHSGVENTPYEDRTW